MAKLIFSLITGLLLVSFVLAQSYSSSTTATFVSENETSNMGSLGDIAGYGNLTSGEIIWTAFGILLFLVILYLVFRKIKIAKQKKVIVKNKKVSKKKKF